MQLCLETRVLSQAQGQIYVFHTSEIMSTLTACC